MNALLSKLAVIGVVAGGFYATGDLPRLIDRGRRIAERTGVPPSPAESRASAENPPPSAREMLPPAPPPAIAAARPAPPTPAISEAAAATPIDPAAEEPTRIPMPALALEAVDLAALHPGQRVLLLCGRHVLALDVVDGPAGEVLEHAHACHADRTVTIASIAAPRRLVVLGCSAGSARLRPRADRRIARGEWIHVMPSGGGTAGTSSGSTLQATETIGPVQSIGIE